MDISFIIQSIFTSGLPVCLMAMGIFLTFRLLDFADMTAEGSFLIGAAITVVSIKAGINPFIATLFAFLGGAMCGIITGVLNRFLKVPKLLSGIITMTACGGIVFLIFGWDNIAKSFQGSAYLDEEQTIYSIFWDLVPGMNNIWVIIVMTLFVLVIFVAIYFFFGTEYGMAIRSTGMNERMASAQGINTTISTIVCIAISNAIIALAASLIYQEGGEVKYGVQSGRLVIGLSAVLIGEAVFGKRTFKNWLISVCLGAILYYVIVTIVLNVGPLAYRNVMDNIKYLIYALLIVLALCLPAIKAGLAKLFTNPKKQERLKMAKEQVDRDLEEIGGK